MITLPQAALETSLKKRAMDIQEKELQFFVDNNHSIGEQSSLLAGFSFAALTMTGFTGLEGSSRPFKMGYYSMAVLSMTCHLITILMATLVRTLISYLCATHNMALHSQMCMDQV